jgi:hypothetical protein
MSKTALSRGVAIISSLPPAAVCPPLNGSPTISNHKYIMSNYSDTQHPHDFSEETLDGFSSSNLEPDNPISICGQAGPQTDSEAGTYQSFSSYSNLNHDNQTPRGIGSQHYPQNLQFDYGGTQNLPDDLRYDTFDPLAYPKYEGENYGPEPAQVSGVTHLADQPKFESTNAPLDPPTDKPTEADLEPNYEARQPSVKPPKKWKCCMCGQKIRKQPNCSNCNHLYCDQQCKEC